MARSKPYGSPPPVRPCALCGKVSSKNIRPRADSDAVVCDFCLGLLKMASGMDRDWLWSTASEHCTFCGRQGDQVVGGLIPYAPAFVCRRCISLALKVASN
jgi:hypothetical protein